MDPFTALGAAGNIIQFVDFSCKLVRNAYCITKSASGASETTIELTAIAHDVQRLSDAIDTSGVYPSQLKRIATQCKLRADELLKILDRLRNHGKQSRWKSFLVALKEVWGQDEINNFVQRLNMLQNQLTLSMQSLLTDKQSMLLEEFSALKNESRRMNLNLPDAIDQLRTNFKDEIDQLKKSLQASLRNLATELQQPPKQAEHTEQSVPSLECLCSAFANLEMEILTVTRNQDLMKSLYFPRISFRHDKIEVAHERTFQWALREKLQETDQPIHFANWLRSRSGVFWVRGKAGAGKSTLMKHICRQPETQQLLQEWAGQKQVVTAKYFFWDAGTGLQKSQEGLLRTLIFDILNSSHDLIPIVQQKLSDLKALDGYDAYQEPWSDVEVMMSICKEILSRCSQKRFCFFIDGLDEYKSDSDALIRLIESLLEHESVKICASSRPWAQFVDAFGQDADRLIKLEDLTRADIVKYTTDRLYQNSKFCKMKDLDERYDLLAKEVVDRAQGVFLWVYLVVKSFLEGIRYADTVEDMQLRLETFPPDLDDYFRHILEDVPQIYRRKTAQMFSLATAAEVPMPLMIYSFADDLDRDICFAVNAKKRSMTKAEIAARNEQLPPRLDGRSKGLLEVVTVATESTYFKFEVDFLHRTVRDFLRASDIEDMFNQALVKTFNPSRILCNAHLAMLKMAPRWADEMNDDRLLDTVEGFFTFASHVQQSGDDLNELHRTICEASSLLVMPGHIKAQWELDPKVEFLVMAIQAGLVQYVDCNLSNLRFRPKRSYLEYALQLPWKKKRFNGEWELSPSMISCLLRHGESPNQGGLWTKFLRRVEKQRDLHTHEVFETCKILVLEGGAHLSTVFLEEFSSKFSSKAEVDQWEHGVVNGIINESRALKHTEEISGLEEDDQVEAVPFTYLTSSLLDQQDDDPPGPHSVNASSSFLTTAQRPTWELPLGASMHPNDMDIELTHSFTYPQISTHSDTKPILMNPRKSPQRPRKSPQRPWETALDVLRRIAPKDIVDSIVAKAVDRRPPKRNADESADGGCNRAIASDKPQSNKKIVTDWMVDSDIDCGRS